MTLPAASAASLGPDVPNLPTKEIVMHEKFLTDITADITGELKPKCECPDAPERKVESLVVMATINGEPYVWDASLIESGMVGASFDPDRRSLTLKG